MNKTQDNKRRLIIGLIVVLIIIQAGALIYLWTMLRPSESQEEAPSPEPTVQQFQLPTQPTGGETSERPTQTPGAAEEVRGIARSTPVDATNYTRRALMFDAEEAMEHIVYLASNELGGRQPGTPGGLAAGDYVASHFAEYGLQPAGTDGTYFQPFTVPYGRITELPVFEITPPSGQVLTRTYVYRTDYRALTGGYLGAGAGEGQVIWLNECLHDDYAAFESDMVGKIAMCRYIHSPQVYRQAIEHQVGGLLLLDREGNLSTYRRPAYRDTAWVPQTIPAYVISEAAAQDLLVGTGYTLDDISLRFTPTPLATTVKMAVVTEEQEEIAARNVLGFLPGFDPERSDEIIVIGAHYDHLGHEPDGEIMSGANDNASGVAMMLEIARLWQTQDYRPARSVLFAAWDGEEQGLLGSRYYVQNPTHPLTRTIATLNLDMVSAGEHLRIDGEGVVATQLETSADIVGITTTLTFNGSSDHMSFYEAGVPAAMPIWWPDAVYHSVDDKVDVIDPEKLRVTGALSAHTLAALAKGHVELEQAVEQLGDNIVAGDKDAYLAGIDPTDPDLQAAQAAWFDNVWSRELVQAVAQPGQIRIGNGEADVNLTVAYRWADATRAAPSVSYDVRFVQRDNGWYFAGYKLDERIGDTVAVASFPGASIGITELLTTTQEAYVSFVADLGLQPVTGTRFIYYPNIATMQSIARPAAANTPLWLVSSAGLAEIAWGQPITPALVNLALNQMGLPPEQGVWLREGLAAHYEEDRDTTYLPTLVTEEELTSLLDFPDLSSLRDSEARVPRGYAWSATEHILDRYGTEGLRALCATWGQSGDQSTAFRDGLGVSLDQFESAWRAEWIAPLRADAEAIQATIAARIDAVLAQDEEAYIATVNPTNTTLRAEERNWFADLTDHPLGSYGAAGAIVGWSPNADRAIVIMAVNATPVNGRANQITYNAHFVRQGDRWLYDGVAWGELTSEHFVLKYDTRNHDPSWARHILGLSEEAYTQITTDLNVAPALPQEIKVYDDSDTFRTLVFLSLDDQEDGWTGPGESIRCRLPDADTTSDQAIQRIIARELARQTLFARGLETDWLREGVAAFEAGRVIPLGTHWVAGRYQSIVQDAVRRHNDFPLYDLPAWENVPADQVELFYAQSWSLVSLIVEQYGFAELQQIIDQAISPGGMRDTATALRTVLGVDTEAFEQEWRAQAFAAAVPADLIALAQNFDPERARADIAVLSSPEYGGREAGTVGADMAAAYIAEQFAALDLVPMGDLTTTVTEPVTMTATTTATTVTTATEMLTGTFADETIAPAITETLTLTHALERSYLQQFPISHTHLISVPTLTLLDSEGEVLIEFTYHEDFVENAGQGIVENELVWLRSGIPSGLQFGGAVVLQRNVRGDDAYAAQLEAHGAGGLIVTNGREAQELQASLVQSASTADLEVNIPVFEITQYAFDALLEALGMDLRELLEFQSPTFPLEVQARQTLTRLPVTVTQTANVLGLLPGSDPDLADEIIVVGAHYDHIGQSPNGLYFPGANQNGSGVAAMLEMVRVWQEAGYHPARSILFAAWGAEEQNGAGITWYMADPVIPLTQVISVISLDSIANGDGARLMFHGTREHDLPLIHRIDVGAAGLERRAWRQGSTGEGWHEQFNQAGIPTTKLIWAEAEDDFYSLDDTADAIDLDRLANSGEILTLATSWLARR